jgi:hypothetical protein
LATPIPLSIDASRITLWGNVGIGTTAPSHKLHIEGGNLRIRSASNYNLLTFNSPGWDPTAFVITTRDDLLATSIPLSIDASRITLWGNVGIGTTAPSQKLEVCGNAKVVGQIIANSSNLSAGVSCSSDIRYKKDITPLTNALNNVMQLRGVNYFWKTKEFPEKQFPDTKQIGFIAQELEKVYPEVVFTDKDGYKSVDYSRLTPILVEAIKDQQKIIQQLEEENFKIKQANVQIKAELNLLSEKVNNLINSLSNDNKLGKK